MQTPKEEIRNSLLESAGKLFLRKGFLKTSMREIARDAGWGWPISTTTSAAKTKYSAR